MNWEMEILVVLVKDFEISRKLRRMAKEKKLTTSTQINHLWVMVSEHALNNRKKKKAEKCTLKCRKILKAG